jgi:hypothetical protein
MTRLVGYQNKADTTGVEVDPSHAEAFKRIYGSGSGLSSPVRRPSFLMGILYLIVAALGISAATAVGAVTYVAASLLEGWVISVLWRWFIVTTFGLPALSVVAAIGVVIFFRSVVTPPPSTCCDHKQKANSWLQIAGSVVRPFLFLAFGAVWHCFM